MNEPLKTIMLVEDNDDDVFLMRRVLNKMGVLNPLQVVTDGEQALKYLEGAGKYADRSQYPLPIIAFIDLKLPYVDGFEILKFMRSHPAFDPIVAIVLTSSNQDKDNQMAYALGARSYLVKPPNADMLMSLFNSLTSHWSGTSGSSPIVINSEQQALNK